MRKIRSILLLLATLFALTACGGGAVTLDGEYSGSGTIQFSGKKEIKMQSSLAEIINDTWRTGTYKIDKANVMTVKLTGGGKKEVLVYKFSQDGDSIFLDSAEYVKKGGKSVAQRKRDDEIAAAEAEKARAEAEKVRAEKEASDKLEKEFAAIKLPLNGYNQADKDDILTGYNVDTYNDSNTNAKTVVKGNGEVAVLNANYKYVSNKYTYEYEETQTLLDNVRSIYSSNGYSDSMYFVKNNGELWAKGKNTHGKLGDNTGVDKDTAVKVTDNVERVYIFNDTVYAVKTDNSLWAWGQNAKKFINPELTSDVYAPEKIMDNVYDIKVFNDMMFFIQVDGKLWLSATYTRKFGDITLQNAPTWIMNNVADMYMAGNMASSNGAAIYILDGDRTLRKLDIKHNGDDNNIAAETKLFDKVSEFKVFGGDSFYVVLDNGEYWGWGKNSDSRLGDSTKIDRDTPVKIADNVRTASAYTMLKTDNTLWKWSSKEVDPQKIADNVQYLTKYNYYIDTNHALWQTYKGDTIQITDTVKVQ
ncbi:hypothetical protein AGMMS49975_06210 [Clostridia bacterium]|nr:hypothetical protein AGMMS49975_06210 [Clostridia bacterium]